MGYAATSGRAITNPNAPRAFAVCDRCGMWYNHHQLRWQMDYRGTRLANLRILVCETCLDKPQPQLRPRIIPPDPVSIKDARVEPFCQDEIDDRTTTNPALPPVDFGVATQTTLAGLQFIGAHQLQAGELVLVMGQTDPAQNGIYKVASGLWLLQGYDNARQVYVDASAIDTTWSNGALYLIQLGLYKGAVYVARGTYSAQLFQIDFADPAAVVGAVAATIVAAATAAVAVVAMTVAVAVAATRTVART